MFLARVRVSRQYFPVLDCISYSCARKRSWLSLWLWLVLDIFQFWNVYRTVRKKDFVFLARVRVSSQYFPVHTVAQDWVSYSCAVLERYRTVRKKDFVFLARVRVSSQYFPVLDCISYSCARRDIGYTVAQERIVALAVVMVSTGYFPVLECISYSTQEGLRVSR